MPLSKEDFFEKAPPKPLNAHQFGAIHCFLEIAIARTLLPNDFLHRALMLKDLVRQHFIHLGGDPKELEE